jgi:hypothetical protein
MKFLRRQFLHLAAGAAMLPAMSRIASALNYPTRPVRMIPFAPGGPSARCEFATLRERLIKIGARVIEHIARIRVQLPTSCPEGALFRAVALGLMPSGP